MMTENIIAIEPLRFKAQIFFEENKRKTSLYPCDKDLYPEVRIECFKNRREYNQGDTIEVVQMQSSNGHSYFYSY